MSNLEMVSGFLRCTNLVAAVSVPVEFPLIGIDIAVGAATTQAASKISSIGSRTAVCRLLEHFVCYLCVLDVLNEFER
jgi:hypothetical protein